MGEEQILAFIQMLSQMGGSKGLSKLGGGGQGEGDSEAPPNVFGGGDLLSDKNLLYTGGAGQPGAAQFAPQSYKGVPTFTGGVPYPPSEYEKIHAIMSILNNLGAGLQTMKKSGGGGRGGNAGAIG